MIAIDPMFLMTKYPGRQWSLPTGGALTDIQWLDDLAAPATIAADWNAWTQAQPWIAYQQQAKAALEATSVTMERIHEAILLGTTSASAPDVIAFMNYRRSLRAIVSAASGTPGTLPARPAYPAGT